MNEPREFTEKEWLGIRKCSVQKDRREAPLVMQEKVTEQQYFFICKIFLKQNRSISGQCGKDKLVTFTGKITHKLSMSKVFWFFQLIVLKKDDSEMFSLFHMFLEQTF